VDVASSDIDKTKAFYTGLFGWDAESFGDDYGRYVVFSLGGHVVAGAMPKQPGMEHPDVWTTYIATGDCGQTVEAAKSAGGSVLSDTMEIPDTGTMAVLQDPAGGVFGLWEAGNHKGFGRYNEPGSVTWDELQTKDFKATTAFYSSVFTWEIENTSDTDDFRYAIGKVDGQPVAGMFDAEAFLPAAVPTHWAVYFSVDNADEMIQKVLELGGKVIRPAENTPFGRIADVADPTGTPFKLHQELPDDET
jgi:hypothetical protein